MNYPGSSPTETTKKLGHYPSGDVAFRDWFTAFSSVLGCINNVDIYSEKFSRVSQAVINLFEEAVYELGLPLNRSVGSVYDRNDYLARELLRTNRVIFIQQFYRKIVNDLAQGVATIGPDTRIINKNITLSTESSSSLLVGIPTFLALSFTASETIGVINIDEILKILLDVFKLSESNLEYPGTLNYNVYDIYTSVLFCTKKCLENLQMLNTSLFFTQFSDFNMFVSLVQLITREHQKGRASLVDHAILLLNTFIQTSQADSILSKYAKDSTFGALYKEMMEKVINPIVSDDRSKRGNFRPIIHYSRSFK